MRLLIKKCKIGVMKREIHFEATKDDWPEIFVEVNLNDYMEEIIAVPIETLIQLWEIVVRKKSLDKYLEDYDLKEKNENI